MYWVDVEFACIGWPQYRVAVSYKVPCSVQQAYPQREWNTERPAMRMMPGSHRSRDHMMGYTLGILVHQSFCAAPS